MWDFGSAARHHEIYCPWLKGRSPATFWPASAGWSAARIEEQLVATSDGCEIITRFPRRYYAAAGPLPATRETQSNLNRGGTTRRSGRRSGQGNVDQLVPEVISNARSSGRRCA